MNRVIEFTLVLENVGGAKAMVPGELPNVGALVSLAGGAIVQVTEIERSGYIARGVLLEKRSPVVLPGKVLLFNPGDSFDDDSLNKGGRLSCVLVPANRKNEFMESAAYKSLIHGTERFIIYCEIT